MLHLHRDPIESGGIRSLQSLSPDQREQLDAISALKTSDDNASILDLTIAPEQVNKFTNRFANAGFYLHLEQLQASSNPEDLPFLTSLKVVVLPHFPTKIITDVRTVPIRDWHFRCHP